MANDVQVAHANPVAMLSSPDLRRLRRISIGRVQWPGQKLRLYLSGGTILTDSDRARAKELLSELNAASKVFGDVRREQFGLIAKLLLTYPTANASAETGAARGAAYLDALDDIPPAVLAEAIRRWNRGEAGTEHDYRWAPAPAVLRSVCTRLIAPLKDEIAGLETLLSAMPMERAMDPRPLEKKTDNGLVLSMRRA